MDPPLPISSFSLDPSNPHLLLMDESEPLAHSANKTLDCLDSRFAFLPNNLILFLRFLDEIAAVFCLTVSLPFPILFVSKRFGPLWHYLLCERAFALPIIKLNIFIFFIFLKNPMLMMGLYPDRGVKVFKLSVIYPGHFLHVRVITLVKCLFFQSRK